MSIEEFECRVCRGVAELPSRPLCSPCLCSGSIMYCHQDCLEEWLNHSKKNKCELCGSIYHFTPVYAENMPSVVPIFNLVSSGAKIIFLSIIPLILKLAFAFTLWLGIVKIYNIKFIF